MQQLQTTQFEKELLELIGDLLRQNSEASLYQLLLDRVLRFIPGAEMGSVLLKQADDRFQFAATSGYNAKILKGVRLAQDELYHSQFANQEKDSFVVTDLDTFNSQTLDDERLELLHQAGATKAKVALAIPIYFDGAMQAVLSVENSRNSKAFDDFPESFAGTLGRQLAVVLQHILLKLQAERQARDLALLDQVRTAVSKELDFKKLMKKAVAAIAKVFGYSRINFFRIKDQHLYLQISLGHGAKTVTKLSINEGIVGRVARSAKAELVVNVHKDPDYICIGEAISEIAVPIVQKKTLS